MPVLWNRYLMELRAQRGASPKTVKSYQDGWNSLMSTARMMGWRTRDVEDLKFENLIDWQNHLKEEGKKEWTCRTYLMAVKGFSRWLSVNGHTRTDVAARFKSPRLRRVLPVLPPFAELEERLEAEPNLRNKVIIAIALYGGLRAQEIASLRRHHFVNGSGLMGFVGKGSKQRSVALPAKALRLVDQYLCEHKNLPPDAPLLLRQDVMAPDRAGISYQVVHEVVTRWAESNLSVRISPHKLRHAYGKHCVDRGVDIRVIAEALGHDSLDSTRIYTQVSFERVRQIAVLFETGLAVDPQAQITTRKKAKQIKQFSEA